MKLYSLNRKSIGAALKYSVVLPFALLLKNKYDNTWLISERSAQARDNGYVFFEYMQKEHPEQSLYYLIDKNSQDYQKLKKYDNVIQFNSWKHYFYYCLSRVHISAHVNGCCPEGAIGISRRTKYKLRFQDIFIPHGVSYGISEFCLKKYADINLFICSGKQEYDNVLRNYGYSENEVVYTGFPRLDKWHDIRVNKKQIVLMPTWRLYLAQDKEILFEKTKYFEVYQNLLRDIKLKKFLEEKSIKLVFYLHNEMRKYADCFKTECANIEIVYKDEQYDIQELLMSSALLITDYSSVHFDFAYMKKPVIYFQFDKKEFFDKQYKPGDFQAEKNGFGPVVYEKEQLLNTIMEMYKEDFSMSVEYNNRMRMFYQIYDNHNCERVYREIYCRYSNI